MIEGRPSGLQAALVGVSVRLPRVVLTLACALLVFGLFALARAKYDVFPEFAPPTVVIQTEAPGLDPEQVEVLVTQAIEVAVNGLPGLETLRSSSIQGLSVITAVFRAGSDVPADVRALGRVSDAELRALYEGALCLLFPSRYEGFGLPPVEAMWCRCPVVAAPMGALPEVCGEAALWFDAARPASLGEAVAALADDAARRDALADAGHARARGFSWDAAARRLLGFIAP